MKVNKYITLGVSVVLNAMIMTILATPAVHAETTGLNLIWSDTSKTVNRSTEALAAGRTDIAARMAEAAMAETLNYGDRLIAAHNLCVALAGRDARSVESHCRTALAAPLRVVAKPVGDMLKIRGGRVMFVSSIGAQTLSSVMRANIRKAYRRMAPQTAEFESAR